MLDYTRVYYGLGQFITRCNRPEYSPGRTIPGVKAAKARLYRVYYGLGQFLPRGKLWPRPIHTPKANYTIIISTTISLVLSDIFKLLRIQFYQVSTLS